MHHTPWTKIPSSSLPSDRIPPARAKQSPSPANVGGKGKQKAQPQSSEVRRLQKLRDALKVSTGGEKDPKGGCFCQARMHALSPYTPICRNCGLILCALHHPSYACPSCASPLLSPPARAALLHTIDTQISDTLAQEEAERARALEEARTAAGAFPALSAATTKIAASDALVAHPVNQSHKVLSLNAKTKRVTVASYPSTPAISRSASRDSERQKERKKEKEREREEQETRVPPPPKEVPHVSSDALDPLRPWANLRGGCVTYVPPPKAKAEPKARESGASKGRSRRRGTRKEEESGTRVEKEKEKENQ